MSAPTTSASEMASLKARLKATWMSGDFDKIARIIEAGGAEFIARLHLTPGARLLDVACGTGNLSFPAARAGAIVTGVELRRTCRGGPVRKRMIADEENPTPVLEATPKEEALERSSAPTVRDLRAAAKDLFKTTEAESDSTPPNGGFTQGEA